MAEHIIKQEELHKLEYYQTHLSIINCFLPTKMTAKEIEVMSAFMCLDGDIAGDRFGSTARKIVRTQLNLSPAGLTNYFGTLIEKKFLLPNSKGKYTIIRPILFPEKNEQKYSFKLVNLDNIITPQVVTQVASQNGDLLHINKNKLI